jgi:hypothetical protein
MVLQLVCLTKDRESDSVSQEKVSPYAWNVTDTAMILMGEMFRVRYILLFYRSDPVTNAVYVVQQHRLGSVHPWVYDDIRLLHCPFILRSPPHHHQQQE